MITRKLTVAVPAILIFLTLMTSQLQAASVDLSWTPPTKNTNGTTLTDLQGYIVYYRQSSQSYGTGVPLGKVTDHTLSGLTGGRRYYFVVTARDMSGNESAFSNEVYKDLPNDSVPGAPVANFTATPTIGSAPLAVAFNSDTSTGSITSWAWTFGDGGTSTLKNPTRTYQTAGTYTVSLKVSGSGTSNTMTKTGYISILPTGLVAAYNFNEGSGSTVKDLSGKGNHGAITGATWTSSGRYGKALLFDGVNDRVRVNHASSLNLTTGMTLEAWVYPTASQSGWKTLILKETSGDATYYLYANSDRNTPLMGGLFSTGARDLYGVTPLAINSTWTHLAATYNGSTQRLYVNGNQVSSRNQTSSMRTSTGYLRIGGNSIWGEYFKGRIDEVRIYSKALSTTELRADRDTPLPTSSVGTQLVSLRLPGSENGEADAAPVSGVSSISSAPRLTGPAPTSASASNPVITSSELLISEHLEVGEIDVGQGWKRVELRKPFVNPIVVAKSFSGHQGVAAVVRIRGVQPTGFEISLQTWEGHQPLPAPEMVGYLVVEQGRFQLPDGSSLESGTIDTNLSYPMHSIAFSQPFRAVPVVMAEVTTALEPDVVIGQPTQVNTKGFQLRMHGQALSQPVESLQTVSYIAWEPSTGTLDDLAFEVNRTQAISRGQISTISVKDMFRNTPVFLADLQSSGGGNPLNVRWEHKDVSGIDIKIDAAPDLRGDGMDPQHTDVVGYILIR